MPGLTLLAKGCSYRASSSAEPERMQRCDPSLRPECGTSACPGAGRFRCWRCSRRRLLATWPWAKTFHGRDRPLGSAVPRLEAGVRGPADPGRRLLLRWTATRCTTPYSGRSTRRCTGRGQSSSATRSDGAAPSLPSDAFFLGARASPLIFAGAGLRRLSSARVSPSDAYR